MPTPQAPIGSGFGFETTVDEVLAGIELSGMLAVVTGGYSGIGMVNVLLQRRRGDRRGACPPPGLRNGRACRGRARRGRPLDLADLDSVRAFAERLLASRRPIDILLNNAGVMANSETRVGPGWESQFATNHLGHFALTNLLWPALVDGGGRVISVSWRVHKASPIQWDDL